MIIQLSIEISNWNLTKNRFSLNIFPGKKRHQRLRGVIKYYQYHDDPMLGVGKYNIRIITCERIYFLNQIAYTRDNNI